MADEKKTDTPPKVTPEMQAQFSSMFGPAMDEWWAKEQSRRTGAGSGAGDGGAGDGGAGAGGAGAGTDTHTHGVSCMWGLLCD